MHANRWQLCPRRYSGSLRSAKATHQPNMACHVRQHHGQQAQRPEQPKQLLGTISLPTSTKGMVQQEGNAVVLQRVVRPAQPNMPGPCCGCTQLVVRILRQQHPVSMHSTYALVGVEACGRQARGVEGRCKHHVGVQAFEVWAVRTVPVGLPPSKGTPTNQHGSQTSQHSSQNSQRGSQNSQHGGHTSQHGSQNSRPSGSGPAREQKADHDSSQITGRPAKQTQAMRLHSCNSTEDLAAFFQWDLDGLDELRFVDSWGQLGVGFGDLVVADGVVLQPPPAHTQQHALPKWRRAQLRNQARRQNTTLTGLQAHAAQMPGQIITPPRL